jgi:hypothetical protein
MADGVSIPKGVKRKSGLFWQEDFLEDYAITIYFDDVSSVNQEKFEKSLRSMQRIN